MAVVVSREVLDGLLDPKLLREIPADRHDQIRKAVAQAGTGTSGALRLGPLALPVREAAKRLQTSGKASKKLARVLPQIAQLPGY
jgi:hypothetical protein